MKRESRDVWAACRRLILQTKSRSWDTHKDLESLSEVNDWGEDPASLQVLCLELIGLYVRNFVSDSSSKSESYLHLWFVLIRDCSRSFKVAYGLPRSCLTVGRRIGWIRSRGALAITEHSLQEIHVSAENLGEILMGDSIENSLYDVRTCSRISLSDLRYLSEYWLHGWLWIERQTDLVYKPDLMNLTCQGKLHHDYDWSKHIETMLIVEQDESQCILCTSVRSGTAWWGDVFALAYSLCIIVYYCVCTCFDPTGMLHQDKAAFKSMIDNEYQARTAEKNRKIGHFGQNPLPAGELVGWQFAGSPALGLWRIPMELHIVDVFRLGMQVWCVRFCGCTLSSLRPWNIRRLGRVPCRASWSFSTMLCGWRLWPLGFTACFAACFTACLTACKKPQVHKWLSRGTEDWWKAGKQTIHSFQKAASSRLHWPILAHTLKRPMSNVQRCQLLRPQSHPDWDLTLDTIHINPQPQDASRCLDPWTSMD